ncbi:class I adenylate-forming enzyme family protein [Rhodococcus sp. NPDC003348]
MDRRFAEVARRHPQRAAVSWLDGETVREMTWAELFARADAVGAALQSRPLEHRRIGLLGRDRVPWIVAMYGAARAGCAIVPVPAGEMPDVLADRCAQGNIDLLVTAGDVAADSTIAVGVEVVDVHTLETAGLVAWEGDVLPRPEDDFLLQFTSGTTGSPKLAVLSHRAVLGSAQHYATAAGGTDGSVLLNPLPLEHVGGIVGGVLSALAIAGTYVSVGRFDPRATVDAIRVLRPAIVGLVPTMVIDILALDGVEPEDFASVAAVVGGATSVDPDLIDSIEQRLDTRFLVAYGQSEAPCLTMSSVDDSLPERTRTIGRPLPGRDYCVVENGQPVPEGVVGELCVRGPLTMTGYLDAAGRPVSVCDTNGWLRTGDLCSIRNGVITFHSRIRDVVIRGGENLYPAEIESVISAMPGVAEVVVFGAPDVRLGERPVAAVRPVAGWTITEADLAEYAAGRLSRQKRPTEWLIVPDFPRTSTGKVRRHDLAALPGTGTDRARLGP